MQINILFDSDSYKASHWLQYPSDLTAMGAYLESRGGEYPTTLFFGLQMLLQQSFDTPIGQEDVDEAEDFWLTHGLPFNRQGWERIVQLHGGRLPLRIRAVPEGSHVPTGNVLLTVESPIRNSPGLSPGWRRSCCASGIPPQWPPEVGSCGGFFRSPSSDQRMIPPLPFRSACMTSVHEGCPALTVQRSVVWLT